MARYVVAEAGEIPPGGRKIVELDGRSVGVFHANGEYFALLNWCPHQAGPLCEGKLWSALTGSAPGDYQTSREGEILACPWHGWEFDLRTGQSWCDPERLRVRAYEVRLERGAELAEALGDQGTRGPGMVQTASDPDALGPGMVKGPYVAQTYPVATEGRYLVVDLGERVPARPAGEA